VWCVCLCVWQYKYKSALRSTNLRYIYNKYIYKTSANKEQMLIIWPFGCGPKTDPLFPPWNPFGILPTK